MRPLQSILASYRATSQSEREKGTYFEELIRTYFRYEATYARNMACGTGKTITSLKIAEEVAGNNKRLAVEMATNDEAHVSARIQDLLKDDSNQLKVDDATRVPRKKLNPTQRQSERRQFLAKGPQPDRNTKNPSKTLRCYAHSI